MDAWLNNPLVLVVAIFFAVMGTLLRGPVNDGPTGGVFQAGDQAAMAVLGLIGGGVILLFTPFAASATRPMKLDVFVEGEPVASWKIESATLQERFIRLDRAEAFPSGVHVKLVIKGATSPKELDMSADPRVLGISLHALRIAAIPEKGT